RRRAEAVLRRQAQILEQIHDAVVVVDLSGAITDWNAGAERIYGYSSTEAVGRSIGFLYFDEDLQLLNEHVLPVVRGLGSIELEERRRAKSGNPIDVHASISLLRGDRGDPVGIISYSIDITSRRRAEERLRRYEAELTHVDRLSLMGEMASTLAHEINQP